MNYIKNIMDDTLSTLPFITWQELAKAQYAFAKPFALKLSNHDVLYAEQVIRLLPGKRITVFGQWRGKNVVAKLFFDDQAKRHWDKEINGMNLLAENKVPSPLIYHHDISRDNKIYVLISERIFIGKSLDETWINRKNVSDVLPVLQSMMIELATQHVLGIVQRDLHLKNFLVLPKKIYTLDGGDIEFVRHLLPKNESMQNLALFFSQFGLPLKPYYHSLFKLYANARGWIIKANDLKDLDAMILNHNESRWQHYSKKIYRECSEFRKMQTWNALGILNRRYLTPSLIKFFIDPESLMAHPSKQILKSGRSTTVIKITLDEREFVIKRYNVKNGWHFLRRMFRKSRAFTTWRMAHKLILFAMPTAQPVAFLEKKLLGLRTVSYSITEYVEGNDAQLFFSTHAIDDIETETLISKLTNLLKNFGDLKITHGDLKLTNVLLNKNHDPVIIDLDGTKEHSNKYTLRRIFKKEIKRFLRNFSDKPYLQREFAKSLADMR